LAIMSILLASNKNAKARGRDSEIVWYEMISSLNADISLIGPWLCTDAGMIGSDWIGSLPSLPFSLLLCAHSGRCVLIWTLQTVRTVHRDSAHTTSTGAIRHGWKQLPRLLLLNRYLTACPDNSALFWGRCRIKRPAQARRPSPSPAPAHSLRSARHRHLTPCQRQSHPRQQRGLRQQCCHRRPWPQPQQ
jgi:hypothetical protein